MYHDYKYKLSGKIVFDPVDLTKKHISQSSWKKTAIVLIDNIDFCKYYSWFIKKRYNVELQIPQRGLHFTIINDKVSDNKKYLYKLSVKPTGRFRLWDVSETLTLT